MKQKVVLYVSLEFKKKFIFCVSAKLTGYSKAMAIAAGFNGVQTVGLKSDISHLEVTGDDIDLISLVTKLNEKIGNTRIVTVELMKEEKKEEKEKKVTKEETKTEAVCHCHPIWKPEVVCYPIECHDSNYGGCTIL